MIGCQRTFVGTEVPLPIAGDLRAWDLVVYGAGEPIGVEAETRLVDLQGLERRISLKMRDGALKRVILLVSATRSNRNAVRYAGGKIGESYPLEGRTALRSLARVRIRAAARWSSSRERAERAAPRGQHVTKRAARH